MAKKAGQLKPFLIEEKREGPLNNISEATANKWIGNLTANIKKDENWLRLITATWGKKKSHNRGYPDDDDISANHVQQMLEYVSQFAPNCLYRDITARATSLNEVWLLVRQWAGLKSSGCKQLVYVNIKKSFTNAQDMPPTDFYFALRNAKEDCLLLSRASGGKVTFNGTVPHDDEDLSPTLENDVVLDWLEAIGGNKLVEHVFRVFSKELESESLFDIRLRISESLTSLVSETEMQAELNRASVRAPFRTFKRAPTRQMPSSTWRTSPPQTVSTTPRGVTSPSTDNSKKRFTSLPRPSDMSGVTRYNVPAGKVPDMWSRVQCSEDTCATDETSDDGYTGMCSDLSKVRNDIDNLCDIINNSSDKLKQELTAGNESQSQRSSGKFNRNIEKDLRDTQNVMKDIEHTVDSFRRHLSLPSGKVSFI